MEFPRSTCCGTVGGAVFLYAFDLIELTGDDRRRDPLEQRKLDLSRLLAKAGPGLRLNEWVDGGEHAA